MALSQGELRLTQDVTIDGYADTNGTRAMISGGRSGWSDDLDGSRILRIGGASTDVMLRDLTLAHGFAHEASGGAIQLNGGTLALTGFAASSCGRDG